MFVVNKIQSIIVNITEAPYVIFMGFLLDDGPKPSPFEQNLAFLSKVRVKMCKNIERVKGRNLSIVARRVKTGIFFLLALGTDYAFLKSMI